MKTIKISPTIHNFVVGQTVRVHLVDGSSVAGVVEQVNIREHAYRDTISIRQGTGKRRAIYAESIAKVERK